MRFVDYAIMSLFAALLLVLGLVFLPGEPFNYKARQDYFQNDFTALPVYSENLPSFSVDNAYREGCQILASKYECDHEFVNSVVVYKTADKFYTLGNVCAMKDITDSISCAQSCGCGTDPGAQASVLSEEPQSYYSDNPARISIVVVDEVDFAGEDEI